MQKRLPLAILMAWMLVLSIDFLFHASILAPIWAKPGPAVKPLTNLALLIPAGYGGYLLLAALGGWAYSRAYPSFPGNGRVLAFAATFAGLFAGSNFLGMVSYLNLSTAHIALINVVYFLEVVAVIFTVGQFSREGPVRRRVWICIGLFLLGIALGIVVQNVSGAPAR